MGSALQSQILISLIFGDKLNNPGIEFGLEGGITLSSVSGFNSNKMLPAFGLGFYFDIKLKNQLYLNTGLYVKSTYGVKLDTTDLNILNAKIEPNPGDYRLKLNYFSIPILLRYRFKNHMYFELGPQAGLMYKSYVEYNDKIDDKDIRVRTYNRELFNKIDVGATAGMGIVLQKGTGMTIGVKYYYGFTNVLKDVSGTKNSSLFIKCNIPIGRGKKKKDKEVND